MTEAEIQIRAFKPGDEQAINRAFNQVFRQTRQLAEWAWKFPDEPEGRYIMVAEREGEILTQYAGTVVRFQIDGRRWTTLHIVDAFATHEARRSLNRKGLWIRTVEKFYDAFGRSGRAPLQFGLPGRRHRRLGILQLGYDAMEPQPVKYLVRRPGAGRSGRRRHLYRAELGRDWEPRLDRLWERVSSQYPVAVVRDANHGLRRFAGHPRWRYHRFLVFPRLSSEPVALAFFRSDEQRLRWADFLWDHDHPGALELAAHLSGELAARTGCLVEEMWLNGDAAGQARLERLGFEKEPEPQGLEMCAKAFDDEADLTAMGERMYITMGDSDLV